MQHYVVLYTQETHLCDSSQTEKVELVVLEDLTNPTHRNSMKEKKCLKEDK